MKPLLPICLLLATGCTVEGTEPTTPTEKAVAAFLKDARPGYEPQHFAATKPYTVADSVTLRRQAFIEKDDALTAQRRAGAAGLDSQIAANLQAEKQAFSTDTTRLGATLWHRYKYRAAQGTKEETRRFAVYTSGRVSMIDSLKPGEH